MEDTPEAKDQVKDTPEQVAPESKELQEKLVHYEKIIAEKDKQIDLLSKMSEINSKAQETLANSVKSLSMQVGNEDPYAWMDRELNNFVYDGNLQVTANSDVKTGVRELAKAWMKSCLQSGMSKEETYNSLERIFKEVSGETEPRSESPEAFDKQSPFAT